MNSIVVFSTFLNVACLTLIIIIDHDSTGALSSNIYRLTCGSTVTKASSYRLNIAIPKTRLTKNIIFAYNKGKYIIIYHQ